MNRALRLLLWSGLVMPAAALASPLDWFLTPEQQGQRLFERGEYTEAAQKFTEPARIGAALFAAKDFEGAAAVFGRQPGPEGPYNRGNALVLLGRYEEAISAYDLALQQRPDWREAAENRAIARIRLEALAPPESDAGGTGGQMGADEIVMDDSGRVAASGEEQVIEAEDEVRDEASLRALWLRRVETRPADFLAAKFNAQLARDTTAEEESLSGDTPGDAPGDGP
jgi:Ca-activated chloride channel family protein